MPRPRKSTAAELTQVIRKLHTDRRYHAKALAEIDKTLSQFNLKSGTATPTTKAVKRGRPPAAKNAAKQSAAKSAPAKNKRAAAPPKTARRRYAQTGSEFILSLLKAKGAASTAEIAQAWEKKRGGKPHTLLMEMTRSRTIIRTPLTGGRGSSYSLRTIAPSESRPTA